MTSLDIATCGALVLAGTACGNDVRVTPLDAGSRDADLDGGDDGTPLDGDPDGLRVLDLTGAITPVHDPALVATPTGYYLFSTGQGVRTHVSTDLERWSFTGQVFATKPSWITTTSPSNPNELWAPDISFFGGQFHLYYSASTFGSNTSCIGHAISATLGPAVWQDQGPIICSSSSDNWNAIDPNAVIDQAGGAWLAFGSFWGGIKLIALTADGARADAEMYALATRENTAVEAPFIIHREGYYYLFESVDFCCRGVNSTYKTMVGRSPDITGPYVDRDAAALLTGGGTLVLEGDAQWRGPGHNAILRGPGGDHNVYHSYDAQAGGIPTLRIAELEWSEDGWPISAGP